MGLSLAYGLVGLGQGLEQGVGNYLAQKRDERLAAIQQQDAADAHTLHEATLYNEGFRHGVAPVGPGSVLAGATIPPVTLTDPMQGPGGRSRAGGLFDPAASLLDASHTERQTPAASVASVLTGTHPSQFAQVTPDLYVDETATPFAHNMALWGPRLDAMRDRAEIGADARRYASDNSVAARLAAVDASYYNHDTPSASVVYSRTHPVAGSVGRTLAEDPAHRRTRQDFNTNAAQLHDARAELRTVDAALAKPLPLLATPQDSAARASLAAERPALAARVSHFAQLADSLAAAERGDPSGGAATSPATTTPTTPTSAAEAAEYARAAHAFTAAGGASNPAARATYERIVAAIAAKYATTSHPSGR